MLSTLDWLALEVKYREEALDFYRDHLGLSVSAESDREVALTAGQTDLLLRPPGPVPRGGVHTHYAFSIPRSKYDDWWSSLSATYDLVEHSFGSAKSLYLYDPDGHCVELGQRDEAGSGITGIFEVVLEVESLAAAEAFYAPLASSVVDRGTNRRRIRLDLGPVDVELWEPQLGLADARGGVHVDLGFTGDPAAVVSAVEDLARDVTDVAGGIRVKDQDGHYLTVKS